MSIKDMSEKLEDKFRDIEPLRDEEVKQAIQELLVDPGFMTAIQYVIPSMDWDDFERETSQYENKFDFQSRLIAPLVWGIARKTSSSITSSKWDGLEDGKPHLILSNHRDIILDAGILNIMRHDRGMPTTEIGIGDNLLIYPWIKKIVRMNKSFLVKRNVNVRQMLDTLKQLSEYIHYAITHKNESVWLAQREGRAKDSNDRTQPSLLKMLSLSPEGGAFLDNIRELDIVPLAISYEYDPCDYLKAQEFQLKRDCPDYAKTQKDDLKNMETGLIGFKGDIHFQFGSPINDRLDGFVGLDRKALPEAVAACIDSEIHRNYKIYPCNYIAYDMLYEEERFTDKYTQTQKDEFNSYLAGQIGRIHITKPDVDFLKKKLLEMYSNTLKNNLSTQ